MYIRTTLINTKGLQTTKNTNTIKYNHEFQAIVFVFKDQTFTIA